MDWLKKIDLTELWFEFLTANHATSANNKCTVQLQENSLKILMGM
jgi:hypothetical protein